MCVCVRERERGREREGGERESVCSSKYLELTFFGQFVPMFLRYKASKIGFYNNPGPAY